MKNEMIENWQACEEAWAEEKKDIPKGQFDRFGGFVHQDYLLEVALEEVQSSAIARDSFLEKVLDYIEANEEATEKFLKWYYPDYGEEN